VWALVWIVFWLADGGVAVLGERTYWEWAAKLLACMTIISGYITWIMRRERRPEERDVGRRSGRAAGVELLRGSSEADRKAWYRWTHRRARIDAARRVALLIPASLAVCVPAWEFVPGGLGVAVVVAPLLIAGGIWSSRKRLADPLVMICSPRQERKGFYETDKEIAENALYGPWRSVGPSSSSSNRDAMWTVPSELIPRTCRSYARWRSLGFSR